MIENQLIQRLNKIFSNVVSNLVFFNEKKYSSDDNYPENYSKWVNEVTIKNKIICNRKNVELQRRRRSRVFWMDFGKNVGSEFNDPHFCVVIYESNFTAIVVPLSTVKSTDAQWKAEECLIASIGCIDNLPGEKKHLYALVNQLTTVSKQRLSNYKLNNKYYDLRLSNDQMDIIDETILTIIKKK